MSQVDDLYLYWLEHQNLTATELAKACNMQKSTVTKAKKKYGFETIKKWKYNIGDKLGPYEIVLIQQLGAGKGIFECPLCHSSFQAEYGNIISGRHRSCGCGHTRIKDLTGQKFGRLTVVKFTGEFTDSYNALWLCECDCGNSIIVSADKLTSGKKQSCGCLQVDNAIKTAQSNLLNLDGQKFGRLLASYRIQKDNKYYYHCICDCGTELDVPISSLTTGRALSCGCVKSKGEYHISQWLCNHNMLFIKEKTFNDCINPITQAKLRFDFYLVDYKVCIEYDGIQHDIGWNYHDKQEPLEEIQYRDNIKTQYCIDHGIPLYRISYLEYDNIDNRMEDILKELQNG